MAENDDWGTVEVPEGEEDKVEYEIEEEVIQEKEVLEVKSGEQTKQACCRYVGTTKDV